MQSSIIHLPSLAQVFQLWALWSVPKEPAVQPMHFGCWNIAWNSFLFLGKVKAVRRLNFLLSFSILTSLKKRKHPSSSWKILPNSYIFITSSSLTKIMQVTRCKHTRLSMLTGYFLVAILSHEKLRDVKNKLSKPHPVLQTIQLHFYSDGKRSITVPIL